MQLENVLIQGGLILKAPAPGFTISPSVSGKSSTAGRICLSV